MGYNRYKLLALCLALVIAELKQYKIPLSLCARLMSRLNLDHPKDRLDELEADQIDDLVVMIPAQCHLNIKDFPTCATDWVQVIAFARNENLNFFTIPVGEAARAKLNEEW